MKIDIEIVKGTEEGTVTLKVNGKVAYKDISREQARDLTLYELQISQFA